MMMSVRMTIVYHDTAGGGLVIHVRALLNVTVMVWQVWVSMVHCTLSIVSDVGVIGIIYARNNSIITSTTMRVGVIIMYRSVSSHWTAYGSLLGGTRWH